jgi:hypothetical protein
VQVERGEVFSKRAVNHYVLNPLDPDQYHRLLEEMAETKHGPTHIFHLWSYSAYDGEPIDLHMLERDLGAGCYSLLYLIQALASRRADSNSIRLLLASSYAQTIAKNDQVCCARAVVPGLLKAMAQELPWLSYRHIDLDLPPETLGAHEAEDVLQAAVKRLLEEDAHPQGDAEVAFRGARRFVPYLAQVDWSQARRSESAFQKDGMYLITGGLGGIGVELARHLLTRLPVRLLLVGRTPLPQQDSLTDQTGPDYAVASRVNAMAELERLGEVHYAPVDVGAFAGLRQAVEEAESHWG